MINPGKQAAVGYLIFGGLIVMGFGFIVWLMLAGGGSLRYLNTQGHDSSGLTISAFGILIILVGIGMSIAGVVMGLRHARPNNSKQAVMQAEGARIMARFVLEPGGENVYDPDMFDPSELKFMVRVEMPGARPAEFETARQVWDQCGEGLTGRIVFQGEWMSQFVFTVPTQAEAPPDPFVHR